MTEPSPNHGFENGFGLGVFSAISERRMILYILDRVVKKSKVKFFIYQRHSVVHMNGMNNSITVQGLIPWLQGIRLDSSQKCSSGSS